MQLIGETLAFIVHRGRNGLKQHLARRVDLLKAIDSFLELTFGQLELAHQAGGQPCLLEHPRVLSRESFWANRVVCREESKPLVAGPPGNADSVGHAEGAQHPRGLRSPIPFGRDIDVVLEHDAALQIVSVRATRRRAKARYVGVVDAIAAPHGAQDPILAQLPEEDLGRAHQSGHAFTESLIELGEIATRTAGVHGYRKEGFYRELVSSFHPGRALSALSRHEALPLRALQVAAQVDESVHHLLAAASQTRDLD